MELLDRLERRVGDLLQQNQELRKENAQIRASSEIIVQMREENRVLAEALDKERALRGEIDRRIDRLLAGIGEREQAPAPSGQLRFETAPKAVAPTPAPSPEEPALPADDSDSAAYEE